MSALHIPLTIDPKDLRSFRQLDLALENLRRHVIEIASEFTMPTRIELGFEINGGRPQ